MKHTAILLAGVAIAATVPAAANAAVLYSNAPTTTNGDCVYNTACGPQNTGNTFAAQQFSLTGPSVVQSIGFNAIVFGNVYGTTANYFILNSTSKAPGNVLASGSASLTHTAGPTGGFQTTDYSFDLAKSVTLNSGNYFVAFQNVTTNFSDYLSYGVGSGGAFQSNDGGATFSPNYRGASSVAVSVNGIAAAVPEPATWAMMIAGFGMIGFAMRRRSSVKTTVRFA